MTKLIWHSNAPWSPTGYGNQTSLFTPLLAERYDLTISSFYGLEGAPLTWENIPVLPGTGGNVSDNELMRHATELFDGDLRDGMVFTLLDVWTLNPALAAQLNMVCWTPVDHAPPPPKVVDFLAQSGVVPVAMSRFGERMLGRLDPLYCPHAVDTSVYKPYDQTQIREKYGFPTDAFMVGMVAANKGFPSRKGFSQAFQAFRRLLERHENSYLYLHTVLDSHHGFGENIPKLLEGIGIPQDRVRVADQYRMVLNPFPPKAMAHIYSAMDVLLNPSMGEGFGIPQLEAQACGVPVIATDFSAMPEVIGSGWLVKHRPYWSHQNSWQAMPDVDDIHTALELCHNRSAAQVEQDRWRARDHALTYALPKVLEEHMLPALKVCEQRFANQKPVTIAPRQRMEAAA